MLAGVVLSIPFVFGGPTPFGNLTAGEVTAAAFAGLLLGWLLLDRMAARRVPTPAMAVVVAAVTALLGLGALLALRDPGVGRDAAPFVLLGLVVGGLVRGAADRRRAMGSLVALATLASWIAYDAAMLPYRPLRDIHLYLGAGRTILSGASPYLDAKMTPVTSSDQLPFVYPPLTAPLFAALAALPRPLADALWVGGSVAAVVAAFWLLGVRGRWPLLLMAWPAPAVGIVVGNVASFAFLLYALGYRFGPAIVLSGVFKIQSAIPALWLVRERRWRSIVVGVAAVAALTVVALPFMGPHAWVDWVRGLRYFQQSFARFPGIQGDSLTRWYGPVVAAVASVIAIGYALLRGGRNGLARLGLASVVASPTLYFHGLSVLLAGSLALGPELLWFVLGLGPWSHVTIWLTVALVALALLRSGRELELPGDLSPARAFIHPAARSGQVWPVEP